MAIPVAAPKGRRKSTPRTTRRRIAKVRLMRFLTGTGGGGDGGLPMPPTMHGPYSHTLNKGGLQNIMATWQLRATLGRNGDVAVRSVMAPKGLRANDGFFSEGDTTLIFRTWEAPTSYNVPQDWAQWDRPEVGDMLDIHIDEIHLSY